MVNPILKPKKNHLFHPAGKPQAINTERHVEPAAGLCHPHRWQHVQLWRGGCLARSHRRFCRMVPDQLFPGARHQLQWRQLQSVNDAFKEYVLRLKPFSTRNRKTFCLFSFLFFINLIRHNRYLKNLKKEKRNEKSKKIWFQEGDGSLNFFLSIHTLLIWLRRYFYTYITLYNIIS